MKRHRQRLALLLLATLAVVLVQSGASATAIGTAGDAVYLPVVSKRVPRTATPTRAPTHTPRQTATATPTNLPTATVTPGIGPSSTPTQTSGSLPPLPAGVPRHFAFGLGNFYLDELPSGTPYDFRYQYLCAGVNTGSGWANWNPNGDFATYYIRDSRSRGLIPVFIYYQILQSAPSYNEYNNLQNTSTMRAYYDDFKLLMQKSAAQGGPIFVNVEPDLTGFMQQHSSNTADNPALQPTSVASSGHPDVQGYPNTLAGLYQALAHLRDLYAPNVSLGIDVSPWAARDDITLVRDQSYNWQAHADRTASYLKGLSAGYQLLFFSPLDRDAAFYQYTLSQNRWWDDTNATLPNFDRMANWMGRIMAQLHLRTLMWQVPIGNRVYRTENNTDGHYQDNRPEYFLNPDSGRAHIQQWANLGFIGMMFGAGAGGQSTYTDAKGDGVTNPAGINGNNEVSSFSDDDGGYLRLRIASYYSQGTMGLP